MLTWEILKHLAMDFKTFMNSEISRTEISPSMVDKNIDLEACKFCQRTKKSSN